MDLVAKEKYEELKEKLEAYAGAVVAFSGGVDSSLLLAVAKQSLGAKVIAVTVVSDFLVPAERQRARMMAREMEVEHREVFLDLLEVAEVATNPPDRCFHCKYAIMSRLLELARREGHGVVLEGSQLSDSRDYRPGLGAVRSLGIHSPLKEAGLTKKEIRIISRELGLSSWDQPAMPCLATRFPYGSRITSQGIQQVSQGEAELARFGFASLRLRHHGPVARVEVDSSSLALVLENREEITKCIKETGFTYVTLDLAGYRSGSMDEVLDRCLRDEGVES